MDEKELNTQKNCNYSREDGRLITGLELEKYSINKDDLESCSNCGSENDNLGSYCKNCGAELYSVFDNSSNKKYSYDLKKILITCLSSVFILYIASLIYKGIIFMEGKELNELVNSLHILLAMNLGNVDIFTTSMISSGAVNIKAGMIVMVALPIITLAVVNLIFMKESNDNIKSISVNSVAIGLCYGVILAILSAFSKVRINMGDNFLYSSAVVYGFSTFSLLGHGFVLGFISTFIVGLFKVKDKNVNIEIIKNAIKTVGLGIGSTLIILVILSFFNKGYIHELGLYNYVNKISFGVVVLQLAVYLWAFANLVPVTIGSITLSLLGLGSISLSLDTKLVLISLILTSALILLVAGNKLKEKYKSEGIKPVKMFSLTYSLVMGILAFISTIAVSGSNAYSISMGFGVFVAIIVSYIYSFIITLIGYKLS